MQGVDDELDALFSYETYPETVADKPNTSSIVLPSEISIAISSCTDALCTQTDHAAHRSIVRVHCLRWSTYELEGNILLQDFASQAIALCESTFSNEGQEELNKIHNEGEDTPFDDSAGGLTAYISSHTTEAVHALPTMGSRALAEEAMEIIGMNPREPFTLSSADVSPSVLRWCADHSGSASIAPIKACRYIAQLITRGTKLHVEEGLCRRHSLPREYTFTFANKARLHEQHPDGAEAGTPI